MKKYCFPYVNKLRIIHIIPNLKKGGAERLVINIMNELLQREDVICLLVVFSDDNEYPGLTKDIPIEVCKSHVSLSILKKHKADLTHLKSIITKFRPHLIHTHLFETEILTRFNTFPKVCYVTHMHQNEKQLDRFHFHRSLFKKTYTNYFEKLYLIEKYKHCHNNFIAISKHTETYLKEVLPYSFHKRIYYLPNAIDYDSFYYERNIDSTPLEYKFVTIGRLVENKNQGFLVDVIEELHKRNFEAELEIIGEGQFKEKIQTKINQKNLSEFIHMRGLIDNVQEILKTSYLYLHAATYEPFGLVLLEAGASGLPVISLDGGGNREVVIQGKSGFLIKEHSATIFADRIQKVMENKKKYACMSQYAIRNAKNYDIKNYVQNLLIIYHQMFES
ncbi:MAG: glycosyltransferase [Bacteroidales bacterium]|nr:glycosyltransferase [Bacteroidales bacterium]